MTLNLDTSKPLRSLPPLEALVRAVRDAPESTQEQPFVEWKSTADAQEPKWRAELAKQVLGMANRDPEAAAPWFGGCGYILVGVEPRSLNGSPAYDSAKIENWLAPYVGRTPNGPEWISTSVQVDGKDVLVLTVEAPQVGQGAWPCRKSWSDPKVGGPGLRKGAIYVRHKASTEEADDDDVEMLSRRAAGGRRRIRQVALTLTSSSSAVALDLGQDPIGEWEERERESLKPLPPPAPLAAPKREGKAGEESGRIKVSDLPPGHPLRDTARMMADVTRGLDAALKASSLAGGSAFGWEPDKRTPEEYAKQVDDYIAKATKALPAALLRGAQKRGLGRVGFRVHNATDDPIHGLQVEVRIPVKGVTAFHEDEIPMRPMPSRPVRMGKGGRNRLDFLARSPGLASLNVPRPYDYINPAIRAMNRGVKIDNSNSVLLTFDPLDLYPQEETDLAEVFLIAHPDLGPTLTAEWTARSRDASGVVREKLAIEVVNAGLSIDELLAAADKEPEESEDDDD